MEEEEGEGGRNRGKEEGSASMFSLSLKFLSVSELKGLCQRIYYGIFKWRSRKPND